MVGEEFDFDGGASGNENDILEQTGDFGAFLDSANFKGVAMEMDGVIVHALVVQDEAIALSGLQAGKFIRSRILRIGEAVDEPQLFVTVALEFGVEGE